MRKIIAIIGGSGFVGQALRKVLAQRGFTVRVVSRYKGDAESVQWRIYEPENGESLQSALTGCHAVVNLMGILNSRLFHPQDFYRVHVTMVSQVLAACKANGIFRYLHMSALNADPHGGSVYLRTKGEGEQLAFNAPGMHTTVFCPSVIFGPGDGLLNRFAQLLRFAPPIFPLACADALFAPVYVHDVAERIVASMEMEDSEGKVQLCGPQQYSLREIVEYTAGLMQRTIKVVALSDSLSKIQAYVLNWVPGRPFSIDNYNSLQVDSICSNARPCRTRLEDVGHLCLMRK